MKTKVVKSLQNIKPVPFDYMEIGSIFWAKEQGICIKCEVQSTNRHIAVNLHDGKERVPRVNTPCYPLKCVLNHEPYPDV